MKKFNSLFIYLITSILFLGGCTNNINHTDETSDPFEKFNRKMFAFNKDVDKHIVKPISKKYVSTVPVKARESIRHHLHWMRLPNTIINSAFQLDIENTILASAKFMLNGLTLGFYDLDDKQTNINKKDFGSTLAKYNVPEGPFLMIPFLGPKNTRDFSGFIIDKQNIANIAPNNIDDINLLEVPINIIDAREKLSTTLDSVYRSSDPYIKMRSFYLQNRRATVYSNKYNEAKDKEKDQAFEQLLQ
jgi:phospholipid-binding lipoprotein MlaA